MNNDSATTEEHTNPEQIPDSLIVHGTESTARAERRAWYTAPGSWEVTLVTHTSPDHADKQPTLVPGAATASIQRDGRLSAPATPRALTAAFDVTHVTRPDQANLRRYQIKQSLNANPLSPGANYRVTRCPLRTNAT